MVPGVVGSSPISHPTRSRGSGLFPGPRVYFLPAWGRSQAVRQGTLTPSCAGSSPAVPASSEIPLTAPFPPGGENCAGREISSLLQGGAGSPLSNPHPCGGTGDERRGEQGKGKRSEIVRGVHPRKNGGPRKIDRFCGEKRKEWSGRSPRPAGRGRSRAEFLPTTTR